MMSLRQLLTFAIFGLILGLAIILYALDVDWSSPQVQQATIAGMFLAFGWIAAFLLGQASALIERRDKARDVMTALLAEIEDFGEAMALSPKDAKIIKSDLVRDVMAAAKTEAPFHPYFASIADSLVAARFQSDLRTLPDDCVAPVVQFYGTINDLQSMLADIRSDHFRALPPDRRLPYYMDFIDYRLFLAECVKSAKEAVQSELDRIMPQRGATLGHLLGVRMHGK